MSKHTPGPWKATVGAQVREANKFGRIIANVYGPQEGAPEGKANTRLIAAAPEMFDALRELTIAAEAAGWDIGDNASVLNAARAAIAKAEGGAP